MKITVKWMPDTSYSIADYVVQEFKELATVFDATSSISVEFEPGEKEKMIEFEKNRDAVVAASKNALNK